MTTLMSDVAQVLRHSPRSLICLLWFSDFCIARIKYCKAKLHLHTLSDRVAVGIPHVLYSLRILLLLLLLLYTEGGLVKRDP